MANARPNVQAILEELTRDERLQTLENCSDWEVVARLVCKAAGQATTGELSFDGEQNLHKAAFKLCQIAVSQGLTCPAGTAQEGLGLDAEGSGLRAAEVSQCLWKVYVAAGALTLASGHDIVMDEILGTECGNVMKAFQSAVDLALTRLAEAGQELSGDSVTQLLKNYDALVEPQYELQSKASDTPNMFAVNGGSVPWGPMMHAVPEARRVPAAVLVGRPWKSQSIWDSPFDMESIPRGPQPVPTGGIWGRMDFLKRVPDLQPEPEAPVWASAAAAAAPRTWEMSTTNTAALPVARSRAAPGLLGLIGPAAKAPARAPRDPLFGGPPMF